MEDYTPPLDLERYPRTDVYVPQDTSGGWALKVGSILDLKHQCADFHTDGSKIHPTSLE